MKAFLLSAGKGTRLKPLTDTIPKCLLPINGKPLLEIWLDHCRKYGITEVLINLHYLASKVEDYLEDYRKKFQDIKITAFYEEKLLGSAGTVLANRDFVKGEKNFFIIYTDNLTRTDLRKMLVFHLNHKGLFTIGLFRAQKPEECGIVEIDKNGIVTSFIEKPTVPRSNLANSGIYIASSELFDHIPKKEFVDFGYDVIPKLIGEMYGYVINDPLIDIGTHESYKLAQKEWMSFLDVINFKDYAINYFKGLNNLIDGLPLNEIEEIINILWKARNSDRYIFILGNGGSAATASHFACDLGKGTIAGDSKRFKVIALTDNVPVMTAWGNDTIYENIFSEQLRNLLNPDDVVIGISGSGNSANVLNAMAFAKKRGAITIAFTGFDGGKVKDVADICLVVPCTCIEQAEDTHLILHHLICTCLRQRIKEEKG